MHDYVPFYFAPRSPMLYTINRGNVPDCAHRQEDIVHLATTVDDVVASGIEFVFYNYNATLAIAECFSDLSDLEKIDWPLFYEEPRGAGYCRYWQSIMDDPRYVRRMETRQAEFLLHSEAPLSLFRGVGTHSQAKADEVRAILNSGDVALPVTAKPGWYF